MTNAVGLDKARGDALEVSSAPFTDSEPPKDPRWFTLDNVVLGSHCAASTAGASRNMGRMATANLIHDLGL